MEFEVGEKPTNDMSSKVMSDTSTRIGVEATGLEPPTTVMDGKSVRVSVAVVPDADRGRAPTRVIDAQFGAALVVMKFGPIQITYLFESSVVRKDDQTEFEGGVPSSKEKITLTDDDVEPNCCDGLRATVIV